MSAQRHKLHVNAPTPDQAGQVSSRSSWPTPSFTQESLLSTWRPTPLAYGRVIFFGLVGLVLLIIVVRAGRKRGAPEVRMRSLVISMVVAPCLAMVGCSTHIATTPSRPTYGITQAGPTGPPAAGNARFDRPEYDLVFDYPEQMTLRTDLPHAHWAGGRAPGDTTVAVELDQWNLISIDRHNVATPVGDANLGKAIPETDDMVSRFAGGHVSGTEVEAAGLPALEYNISLRGLATGQSRYIVIYYGETEYNLNCESTVDHRAEIASACQTALSTLRRSSHSS